MSILEALIFGIVQGITEFLPISSTAHLVITQILLDFKFPGLAFEIILHIASVLAVILYFRKDVMDVVKGFFGYFRDKSSENKVHFRFGLYILFATLITGVLGLVLEGFFDESLKTPPVIAFSLFVTGVFILFIERFHRYGNKTEKTMGLKDAAIVGLAQTIAVTPGISRSGSTLVAALWTGLNKDLAVKFSFLLSIPIILGSSVLIIKDLTPALLQEIGLLPMFVAFLSSFIFSILGIIWLIDFLKKTKLIYFAVYCFVAAILVFFFLDHTIVMDLH